MSVPCISAGISTRGLRERNEDAYRSDDEKGIFLVADGMGGHHRGDVASSTFIEKVMSFFSQARDAADYFELISQAVTVANEAIFSLSEAEETRKAMGTTAVLCILENNRYHVGWVGDSRAYLLRKSKLQQLTRDHSYVQQLVDGGHITEKDALTHPERNVITRAIGTEQKVETDFTYGEIRKGDLLLLCTDGICGVLESKTIQKILKDNSSPSQKVESLVDTAMEKGSEDNATALLIEIL